MVNFTIVSKNRSVQFHERFSIVKLLYICESPATQHIWSVKMNENGYEPILDILELNRVAPRSRIFQQRRHFDTEEDWTQRYRLQ